MDNVYKQLEILKSKSFYTQHDYEIASELFKLEDNSKFHKEVESILNSMLKMINNNDSDRK